MAFRSRIAFKNCYLLFAACLFVMAQFCSFAYAIETIGTVSFADDIDDMCLEDIVTVDPFLAQRHSPNRIANFLLENTQTFFLCAVQPSLETMPPPSFRRINERLPHCARAQPLWLLNRSLLI